MSNSLIGILEPKYLANMHTKNAARCELIMDTKRYLSDLTTLLFNKAQLKAIETKSDYTIRKNSQYFSDYCTSSDLLYKRIGILILSEFFCVQRSHNDKLCKQSKMAYFISCISRISCILTVYSKLTTCLIKTTTTTRRNIHPTPLDRFDY